MRDRFRRGDHRPCAAPYSKPNTPIARAHFSPAAAPATRPPPMRHASSNRGRLPRRATPSHAEQRSSCRRSSQRLLLPDKPGHARPAPASRRERERRREQGAHNGVQDRPNAYVISDWMIAYGYGPLLSVAPILRRRGSRARGGAPRGDWIETWSGRRVHGRRRRRRSPAQGDPRMGPCGFAERHARL